MTEKRRVKLNYRRIIICLVLAILVVSLCAFGISRIFFGKKEIKETISHNIKRTEKKQVKNTPAPSVVPTKNPEEEIYTYLQGPKSWGKRLEWSGYWGKTFFDGGSFGGFGCGLCCMANVYSSISPYKCTPVDAYKFAKSNTDYTGGGAIDWGYMRRSLNKMGFPCKVSKKPSSYQKFQKDIADSKAAIVLISSYASTCYWKNTPGHYVTIFLYNEKTDKVFLADSGDPNHNRHWVALKKIYKSLKTSSNWQYISIKEYKESEDIWRHKSAKGNWVKKST